MTFTPPYYFVISAEWAYGLSVILGLLVAVFWLPFGLGLASLGTLLYLAERSGILFHNPRQQPNAFDSRAAPDVDDAPEVDRADG